MIRTSPDYQEHIDRKLSAIPIPDLRGKRVLDIGCDHGHWSFMAVARGASEVLGVDRNREVRGMGYRNLVKENNVLAKEAGYHNCRFQQFDLGKQWPDLGRADVIFLFSLYHHIFDNCGDHRAIWYWLWRNTAADGELIWENPVDCTDKVVQHNMRASLQPQYALDRIMEAAKIYFIPELIGNAGHEETRWVYRFKPRAIPTYIQNGMIKEGAGGAAPCFLYADGRRQKEIEHVLGFLPYPGSLNLRMEMPFDFEEHYVRAEILDVVARGMGLDVDWAPRWCRFYPLAINGIPVEAIRFEGDNYPLTMVELIAPHGLRYQLRNSDKVRLERP